MGRTRSDVAASVIARQTPLRSEPLRLHLARELHDRAAPDLTALVLGLKRLESDVSDTHAAREAAASLRRHAADLSRTLHLITRDLRAGDAVGRPHESLSGLVAAWRARNPGRRLTLTGDETSWSRLTPEASEHTFAIIGEALTNVTRHAAKASRVGVHIEADRRAFRCAIVDDGRGWMPSPATGDRYGRYGHRGMFERAALMGGRLRLVSRARRGFWVVLRVPVRQAADGGAGNRGSVHDG